MYRDFRVYGGWEFRVLPVRSWAGAFFFDVGLGSMRV